MSAKSVLQDPAVTPSVAWSAVKKLMGPTVGAWELESIRIELGRKSIATSDELMAKVFAAMTIVTTRTWVYDHDVLFAFALACSGVPANAADIHHPTPEQLCWAMCEIRALTGAKLDADEGFDPDTIDPAIAVVLHDDGYVLAPCELNFAQDSLNKLNVHGHAQELMSELEEGWDAVCKIPIAELKKKLSQLDEEPLEVQIQRLGDCRLYVAEHELLRAKQHAALDE